MTVRVNGESVQLAPGETVADLLVRLNLGGTPCAVEVNERLVPKASHAARPLQEGDVIEVVTLVGGG